MIESINRSGAIPHYFVVKKDRLRDNLRKAKYGIAYNYFAGLILCDIHDACDKDLPISLIVDRRNKETHGHMNFDGYIETKIMADCEHNADFTISHDDSNDKLGLQAVDFIAWALFRHYEHSDPQFFNLFNKNVGKRTCWYT